MPLYAKRPLHTQTYQLPLLLGRSRCADTETLFYSCLISPKMYIGQNHLVSPCTYESFQKNKPMNSKLIQPA